jgi:hypothetical protein
MGVEGSRIPGDVGVEQTFLVHTARLALVQRDQHGDLRIQRFRHQDGIKFVVVEPEHVQVQRDAHARKDVLEEVVNIVAADIEQVKILCAYLTGFFVLVKTTPTNGA